MPRAFDSGYASRKSHSKYVCFKAILAFFHGRGHLGYPLAELVLVGSATRVLRRRDSEQAYSSLHLAVSVLFGDFGYPRNSLVLV